MEHSSDMAMIGLISRVISWNCVRRYVKAIAPITTSPCQACQKNPPLDLAIEGDTYPEIFGVGEEGYLVGCMDTITVSRILVKVLTDTALSDFSMVTWFTPSNVIFANLVGQSSSASKAIG